MILRVLVLLILVSCGQPTQVNYDQSLPFKGLLVANTCNMGESFIVFQENPYPTGSKSNPKVNQLIVDISANKYNSEMLSQNGCAREFNLEFNGDFEDETNFLSNGGQESQRVIQVYDFRIP